MSKQLQDIHPPEFRLRATAAAERDDRLLRKTYQPTIVY